MSVSVTQTGLDQLRLRFATAKAAIADPSPALKAAGIYARDRAVWRINQQGGDQHWQPNKRGGHTGILTGRMIQSIGILAESSESISVGIPGGGKGTVGEYAAWFQYGTGVYAGHSEWTIVPKTKRALAFSVGGQRFVRRSVTMKGQPARPFLILTDLDKQRIKAIFTKYFKTGTV